MGFDEASAYAQLEMELEEALVAGRFVPGTSGWRSRAASLTAEALHEPPPHDGRRSRLEMILSERRRTWVETVPAMFTLGNLDGRGGVAQW